MATAVRESGLGDTPLACRGIVDFGTAEPAQGVAGNHEHSPIWQQSGAMLVPRGIERTRGAKRIGGRVKDFCSGGVLIKGRIAADDQDASIMENCSRMPAPRHSQ